MGVKRRVKKHKAGGYAVPDWDTPSNAFDSRSAVIEIYGDSQTGRSKLALSLPGPVAVIHGAEKLDGLVEPLVAEGGDVRMVNFGGVCLGGPDEVAEKAQMYTEDMMGAWYDAIDNWARTVILDTHTEAWEMMRLAKFGTVTPRGDRRNLYGPLNADWSAMLKHARIQRECNVVIIGRTKEAYKNDKPTGRFVRAGHKNIPFDVDVILRTTRTKDDGFRATIEKGWFNAATETLEFDDDDMHLPYIMSLITETAQSEWEEEGR